MKAKGEYSADADLIFRVFGPRDGAFISERKRPLDFMKDIDIRKCLTSIQEKPSQKFSFMLRDKKKRAAAASIETAAASGIERGQG